MATYTVGASDRGVHAKTLVAATVDTVNFPRHCSKVEIISDGAGAISVTVDGSTPTVAGVNTDLMPAAAPSVRVVNTPASGNTSVKLISAGTPTYSVTEVI